jgi:transposase
MYPLYRSGEKIMGAFSLLLFTTKTIGVKTIVKQVAGIDVAQKELVVQLGKMYSDISVEFCAFRTFENNVTGFQNLIEWVSKYSDVAVSIRYVMEATGVYHEWLAYWLTEKEREVSIVLPNKISNYARSLQTKTVTDKTASQAICRFALERNLEQWHRPKDLYKKLRQLIRERGQLLQERTVLKNQLHAEQTEAEPSAKSIERTQKRIDLLVKQEKEIMAETEAMVKADRQVQQLVVLLCSIPGIGQLSAVTVLAETNGFDLIRSHSQLVSYAGLDVKEKESGTSVKGKPSISKRGNKYLRKALYMPSMAAVRHSERYKAVYARLVGRHGIKMKALVAVQRKLLEMMYTVYKTQKKYDKDYLSRQSKEAAEQLVAQHQAA